MADGYSISGYENLAGDPNIHNDGIHGRSIKIYATKPSNTPPWKKDNLFSGSQLPAGSLATESQENSILNLGQCFFGTVSPTSNLTHQLPKKNR